MTNPDLDESAGEATFGTDYGQMLAEARLEQQKTDGEVLLPRLDKLTDQEYLAVSREFGDRYSALVQGQGTIGSNDPLFRSLETELAPNLEGVRGLDDNQTAREMIEGYRQAMNTLYETHNQPLPFPLVTVTDAELGEITRVSNGPAGIPILFTHSGSEQLFRHDSLSFAAPDLMLDNGLPPLVVVYDGYSPVELNQITAHETSHAVWAVLRRHGEIPEPVDGSKNAAGFKSAFELARDEAAAQLAAGQRKIAHPAVIKNMREDGFDEAAIDTYRGASDAFNSQVVEGTEFKLSDAILGVMQARSFEELLEHMARMGRMVEAVARE